MKRIILLISCILLTIAASAETKTYKISSYCTINIPTTMELRDTPGVNGAQYCFWPGLSSDYYSRVLISIEDTGGLTESDIKNASKADLDELNNYNKSMMVAMLKQTGQNVSKLSWYPMTVHNVNGHYALKMKWTRPGLQGLVNCEEYLIIYKGVKLDITLSYRASESSIWKDSFAEIIKSIIWK